MKATRLRSFVRLTVNRGGENVRVWEYMFEQHNSQSAVLVGSSTQTERIERLWRDVNRCVGVLFADLFREMEHDGILNNVDELDLFCLHVTFLRTITRYPRNITGHRISSL